ncbi:hypothetical protein [Stenotrophomonas chelatiphaga]|uniref:hypothetical protein n=1 Tax=Stenotrophomonas chelatiphaga TaxID=517011 RepID=UPI00289816A8|nr:hypothetical protein [Stenotrophomonas chelatiphaga]
MTTTISESPVTYRSFISIRLQSKAPVPRALPAMRTVSNPARDAHPSSLCRPAMTAPHRSGPASPTAGLSIHAAADASEWKNFVGHLQQRGTVPGAERADPDQGVMTTSNVSVKQMLAYLRNRPPATPAGVGQMVRRVTATAAARAGAGPGSPAAGLSTTTAVEASDWKVVVGRLQQQGTVPGAGRADPDQGVVTPSNISVKQMLAHLRNHAPTTSSGRAQGVRPPVPAAAAAVCVAAVLQPANVPSVPLLQKDQPVAADDPCKVAALLDQMEHQRRGAEAGAGVIDAPLLEVDRAMDGQPGAPAEAPRAHGAALPMFHEEHDEDPFRPSERSGTTPRRTQARPRREAIQRGNAALNDPQQNDVVQRRPQRVGFNPLVHSRVLEVDAESGETISVSDQYFQTKEHDGKWSTRNAQQPPSLNAIDPQPAERSRPAAAAAPHAPTADDGSGFVVHSAFHEDRDRQATHAEIGSVLWADLGRDDERAELPVGPVLRQLQRLQQIERELDAALSRNRELNEDIGVYF